MLQFTQTFLDFLILDNLKMSSVKPKCYTFDRQCTRQTSIFKLLLSTSISSSCVAPICQKYLQRNEKHQKSRCMSSVIPIWNSSPGKPLCFNYYLPCLAHQCTHAINYTQQEPIMATMEITVAW